MADNVAITAGSGTDISTDDCGAAGHAQRIKLLYSADGDATHVLADANGLEVQLGASIPAGSANIGDVDVLSVIPGTGATNLGKAIDTALGATDTGVLALAVRDDALATLTEADADVSVLRVDSTGRLWCNAANAGTFAVQVDGSALTALQLIDDAIFADDAAFTLATSKVSVSGGYAVAHNADPTALTAGRAGVPIMNRHHVPFAIGGHPNIVTASARITGSNTDTALLPGTIGTGNKIVITRLSVTISNATTINVGVKIGFGTANVPADNTTGIADVLIDNDGFPPGGGISIGDGSGMLGCGADGAELRITNDSPTSGAIFVSYSYYIVPS